MNAKLLDHMQKQISVLFKEDTTEVEDPTLQEYSKELLQDICLPGLPLSKLSLNIGAPVMFLWNFDQSNGLNNRSRMIISRIE